MDHLATIALLIETSCDVSSFTARDVAEQIMEVFMADEMESGSTEPFDHVAAFEAAHAEHGPGDGLVWELAERCPDHPGAAAVLKHRDLLLGQTTYTEIISPVEGPTAGEGMRAIPGEVAPAHDASPAPPVPDHTGDHEQG